MFLRDHIQYLGRQKRLCLFNILRDLEITQEQLLFSRLLLEIPVVFSDQRLFLRSKPKTFTTPQQFFRFRIQLIIIDRLGIIDPPLHLHTNETAATGRIRQQIIIVAGRDKRGIATQVTARALIRQTSVHNRFLQDMLQKTFPFDLRKFLAGEQSPVFFGSGVNNFGVEDVLNALVDWAPRPQPRDAGVRMVDPFEDHFSGFVFKIQANMDPRHRDRIAFFRVCSGRYQPGMKVLHVREDREMKIPNALTFMAQDRVIMTDAVAGDIIGIYNHGQLHIGDTLTQGEKLQFTGIPNFAPELFRAARSKDPFKAKQLQKGLQELGEEGAIQVFTGEFGNILLGAVGQLQFEIVAQRLADEYKVDALYESTDVSTARWLSFPDDKTKREFEAEQNARLATDVNGNEVYLATSIYNLETTMKHWPQVQFHTTREMNQVF